ncbi:unnamed protein product, partial [Prorocentrum cordatum]
PRRRRRRAARACCARARLDLQEAQDRAQGRGLPLTKRGSPRDARRDATAPAMPGVVSPVKFPCTPGFVLNAQEVTPRSKKQTLLVTPSGPMVTGRTNSSRSSPLSQLDLEELQRQMADPRHRYDTASRP